MERNQATINGGIPAIVWNDQRVITTELLAAAYGTDVNNIKNNFSRNKDRFNEGEHYFFLTGEELNNLQVTFSDLQISSKTRHLYLWTHRGASRHCKILDTDQAWKQFDILEEKYFNPKPILTYSNDTAVLIPVVRYARELRLVMQKMGIPIKKIAEAQAVIYHQYNLIVPDIFLETPPAEQLSLMMASPN